MSMSISDEKDPLHELLDDLGGQPSLCSLLGAAEDGANGSGGASLAHMAQTEVCLSLSSKHALLPGGVDQRLDVDRLFVRTKQVKIVHSCIKIIFFA